MLIEFVFFPVLQRFEHYSETDGDSFATLIRNKDDKEQPFRIIATLYSSEVSNIAFDIVPVSTAISGSTTTTTKATAASSTASATASSSAASTTSTKASTTSEKKPKRRSIPDKNKHAVFRREINTRNDDENQLLIEKNVSLEDDFADTKAGKLIGSVHKSKKLTAK
jgi:hypothetical protein